MKHMRPIFIALGVVIATVSVMCAGPDQRWENGRALFDAVDWGNLAKVQRLFDLEQYPDGVDVNWVKWSDQTPLHRAVSGEQCEIAEYLLRMGANIEAYSDSWGSGGITPLCLSIALQRRRMTQLLLTKNPSLKGGGKVLHTPLHFAVKRGDEETVGALLDRGADPGAKDRYTITPVHLAIENGDTKIATLLLALGVDLPRQFPDSFAYRWVSYSNWNVEGRALNTYIECQKFLENLRKEDGTAVSLIKD